MPRTTPHRPFRLALLAAATLLGACGGGREDDDAPPARATIVIAQQVGQATRAQIDAGTSASGAQALTGAARCDVTVRYVHYITRDPLGAPTTASAGVLVPTGSDAACTGERPVVLYAHGTSTSRSKNMAAVSTDGEAALVMAMYAAQGFIVVAPNYQGYERSSLTYHPYLNAEAQALDMVDALRAAKAHITDSGSTTQASSKLLLTGYSQGGHVAMATHKVIERDHAGEFTVTATAALSGPYNLVGMNDAVTATGGTVNAGATLFAPLLLTSYQRAYGGMYGQPTDAYQSPWAATIEGLLPSDDSVSTLIAAGKLPADPTFTALWGSGGLLTDGFRAAYAGSAFRRALQANTLLGWTPRRPMALCGGAGDPSVFWALNAPAVQADFATRGVSVPAWDLESAPATSDATHPVYAGFAQAKAATAAAAVAAGATDGGQAAVRSAYHGTLVPPFCNALARGYFQQVLAAGL